MNKIKEQKRTILEGNLTDEELIKITGGETFVSIEDINSKERPIQALYGISPIPPICRPMYGVEPPDVFYPMYGVKPPIIIEEIDKKSV